MFGAIVAPMEGAAFRCFVVQMIVHNAARRPRLRHVRNPRYVAGDAAILQRWVRNLTAVEVGAPNQAVAQALQGDKSKARSIVRVPAAEVEALVAHALGKLSRGRAASQTGIRALIDRVVIGRTAIQIQLSEGAEKNDSAKIF